MPAGRWMSIWNSVWERGFRSRRWSVAAPPLPALRELNDYSVRIPLGVLEEWLARTVVTRDEVRPFLCFSADHYVRNLLYAGPSYQALILCWQSGQRSPIHDHRGSSCAVTVTSG